MNRHDTIKLKIPRQDRETSSFFELEAASVEQWVTQLPMANIGQTTRQLFTALTELNQIKLQPPIRMAILDTLRVPIHYVSQSLSKHYLNKPIVLPEQPRKVADLAQALHSQLATGYTIVATHSAALGIRLGLGKAKELIGTALHRAITEHTVNLQRHFQLYEPVEAGSWHTLHQYYSLAQQQGALQKTITDNRYGNCTVEASYIRALLLGCSKPNELRQEDFSNLLMVLTEWSRYCALYPLTADDLFVIDLDGDNSPVYRELYQAPLEGRWLSFNTNKLAQQLTVMQEQASRETLTIKAGDHQISFDLISHLIMAWSSMSKRTFMRQESDDKLELSVGLSATHHFVSGELSFEALVEERGAKTFSMKEENPFLKLQSNHPHRQKDVWDSPYEANVGQTQVSLESIDFHIRSNETASEQITRRYQRRSVQMINSSANGYCIAWPPDAEAYLKTGEIVGIKEANSHNWSIAAIRWVSHSSPENILLGLELLSPSAAPYGGRIIRKTGADAEYTRVLVLPEIPAIKQPVTLLTPRVPFRVGAKMVINQRGKIVQVALTKKINTSGAYCQFEFRRLNDPASPSRQDSDQDHNSEQLDGFDSLWDNL